MKKVLIGGIIGFVIAKISETETAHKVIEWGKSQATKYTEIAKGRIEAAISGNPEEDPVAGEETPVE